MCTIVYIITHCLCYINYNFVIVDWMRGKDGLIYKM